MSDPTPPSPKLVLASASPRRQELLREAGYEFEVIPADIDEDNAPRDLLPSALARHLAFTKADAVATRNPQALVLAADTVVAFGDVPLGKPADAEAARRMLRLLSGTTHIVITGVAVMRLAGHYERAVSVMSAVRMRQMTPAEIEAYVAGGDWRGKAGGYGIQDRDPFVTRTAGSYTNIVGMPMEATARLLREAGVTPRRSC